MLDVTFNFNFGSVDQLDAKSVFTTLNEMETALNEGQWPTLFFGSHDMSRFRSRLASGGLVKTQLLAFLMLTAKGVPFIYYGEEVGMPDLTFSSVKEMRDIQGTAAYYQALQTGTDEKQALEIAIEKTRDKARGPMIFPDGKPFTLGEPWIKMATLPEKEARTMWRFYQGLLAFRKENDFKEMEYTFLKLDGEVLSYQRGEFIFLLHFGEEEVTYPLQGNYQLVFGEAVMVGNGIRMGAHTGIALRVEE